ncbi:MAG: right-handed parallel beta-helix repeat-containing protein [Thermoplasmata archaeon]|nr:right-handed parallel beta-helix repeat-containing protein [Thermoplasmata archaeon]
MKRASLTVTMLVLISLMFVGLSFIPEARATTLYVGGGGPGNHTTIQSAINAASAGDSIYVYNGTYRENLMIDKKLSLVGENRNTTLVDGRGLGTVVHITSYWVNITGFGITNSGPDFLDTAIKLDSVQDCRIESNNVSSNSGSAVQLYLSYGNTISDNILSDNEIGALSWLSGMNSIDSNLLVNNLFSIAIFSSLGETVANNTIIDSYLGTYLGDSLGILVLNNSMMRSGIVIEGFDLESWNSHVIDASNTVDGRPVYYLKDSEGGTIPPDPGQVILANCTGFVIENQTFTNGSVGIELGFSSDNMIANNTLYSSQYGGILLTSSHNNTLRNNDVSGNQDVGIYSYFSNHTAVVNNTISESIMSGIFLILSHNNTVAGNRLSDNWIGIYDALSSNNMISNNVVNNGSLGISVGDSTESTIIDNTMVGNGIYMMGTSIEHWNTHTINTSNSVNGLPVRYWRNVTGGTVPTGAGQVILANCTDVTVENQTISNSSVAIQLGFSWSNIITNNTASSNNWEGITLYRSDSNTITSNLASSNEQYGIRIAESLSVEVRGNDMVSNGILITGGYVDEWNSHIIDTTNTVNGKPVQYRKNAIGGTIPQGAGQVILANCRGIVVENQNLSDASTGILLGFSWNNVIANNTASINSQEAIQLYSSDGNMIFNNTISDNVYGIYLGMSDGNTVYHNDLVNNTVQAMDTGSLNQWDNGYLSGGNYWNDYDGEDLFSGPMQNQPGSDLIGDTPYSIFIDSQDRYPLMHPYGVVPPNPPEMSGAVLSGRNLQNVTITWSLSPDDGGGLKSVVGYKVFRGTTFDSERLGYEVIATIPNQTAIYVDVLAGEGDLNSYFYDVCAFDIYNITMCAENQAGKSTRPLSSGPILVSIPLIQSNESIEIVLQTVKYDKVWSYDSFLQEWKSYMSGKTYKGELLTANHTMGLWVNVTENSSFTVAGVVPAQTTIHLHRGWNLVSFPSQNSSYNAYDLKMDTGALRVEGYDAIPPYHLGVLGDADILVTGEAYWVKVDADTDWTIEAS